MHAECGHDDKLCEIDGILAFFFFYKLKLMSSRHTLAIYADVGFCANIFLLYYKRLQLMQ